MDTFRQELSKLGWIEGKNVAIEYRFAEGKLERDTELAVDFVRLKVDLIMASGAPGVLAAKNATTTIPIVMTNAGDPVGAGLVASLARPGGNVTGFSSLASELNHQKFGDTEGRDPKAHPSWSSNMIAGGSIARDLQLEELRAAATALKLKLEEIATERDAKGLESASRTAKQKQVNAIMTTTGNRFFAERKRIVELADKYRLPAIYRQDEFVEAGGLTSDGADDDDLYRRAAVYVHKISERRQTG